MSQSKHIHTAPHKPTSDAYADDKPAVLPRYNWANHSSAAQLFYVTTLPEADALLANHLSFPSGVVGFDLEWPPTFRKGQKENPVSLVQIATQDAIFLFQVSNMRSFPVQLQILLENPLVIKAGVNIKSQSVFLHCTKPDNIVLIDDAQKLWRDCRIHVLGCAELSFLARSADNARWKGPYHTLIGLARLTEAYLGGVLDKGKITRSNWGAKLTVNQQNCKAQGVRRNCEDTEIIIDAANDAHAGYSLYVLLKAMVSINVDPGCYTFNVVRGSLYNIASANGRLLTTEEAVWGRAASELSPWRAFDRAYDPGPPPERKPNVADGEHGGRDQAKFPAVRYPSKRRQDLTRPHQYNQVIPLLPPHT